MNIHDLSFFLAIVSQTQAHVVIIRTSTRDFPSLLEVPCHYLTTCSVSFLSFVEIISVFL